MANEACVAKMLKRRSSSGVNGGDRSAPANTEHALYVVILVSHRRGNRRRNARQPHNPAADQPWVGAGIIVDQQRFASLCNPAGDALAP